MRARVEEDGARRAVAIDPVASEALALAAACVGARAAPDFERGAIDALSARGFRLLDHGVSAAAAFAFARCDEATLLGMLHRT